MTRPDHRNLFDTDGLQADVMRFMAISAFCLIAIMALVQKLEISDTPEIKKPLPPTTITPVTPPVTLPITARATQAVSRPVVRLEPVLKSEPKEEQQVTPLLLRFVSDTAFLSLISSEEIQLYVGFNGDFFTLTPAFALTEATPAGQLYELLASSVPARVHAALNRERQATTYLVSLPANTRGEIERLSDQFATTGGAIVVGRKGGVTYEP